MGHSRAEKAASHDRILGLAAARLREGGLDAINVAELMREAGLTHGGFYRHFASRADLVDQALARAFDDGEAHSAAAAGDSPRTLRSIAARYLSKTHRDEPGRGCAIAALAGDIARADAPTRARLTAHLTSNTTSLAQTMEEMVPEAESRALAALATMVGALVLARAVDDPGLSDALLRAGRQAVANIGTA